MRNGLFALLLLSLPAFVFASGGEAIPMQKAEINLRNQASLQRGARYFMNYCSGCHSLQYARYNLVAKDIGIVDKEGYVDKQLVKNNLIFTGVNVGDNIVTAMSHVQAANWFGVPPPDLTLEARRRGSNWIYNYLLSFYRDENRPWGTNNLLIKNVAMPNIFERLQGDVYPVVGDEMIIHNGATMASYPIEYLEWTQNGTMNPDEFKAMVNDITNFLTYVAEPAQLTRYKMGIFVLLFISLFFVLAYLLKKEFWKDVK